MIDATHLKAHRTAVSRSDQTVRSNTPNDKTLYRQRHKIENVFGRRKSLPLRKPGTGGASPCAMTDARAPS
jgi:hypothetical protein